MNKHWYLQQIDLFAGIPDSEIMSIAKNMREKTCSKKELIYIPEEENSFIYILKKGEVTLYNSHMGKRLIIETLKPGSIFGNISFGENKSAHFAESSQDSYVCIFTAEDFVKILQERPKIMMRFLQMMSDKVQQYENRLKSGLYDAKEKILQQLELQQRADNNPLNKFFGRKSEMTHERLGQLTGLSRETVTRAINDLKKAGMDIPW
ncbi:MAG: Crp/Fnr family transcriptional regulator [Patescibacteria group bacterium]